MRKLFAVSSGLLVLAVILQFYFAAYGAFTIPFPITTEEHHAAFALHSGNSNVILVLSLLSAGAAWLAKAGTRCIMLSLAPFALVLLQIVIFVVAGMAGGDIDATPPISTPVAQAIVGLHAVNALAILGTSLGAFVRALKHAQAESSVATANP